MWTSLCSLSVTLHILCNTTDMFFILLYSTLYFSHTLGDEGTSNSDMHKWKLPLFIKKKKKASNHSLNLKRIFESEMKATTNTLVRLNPCEFRYRFPLTIYVQSIFYNIYTFNTVEPQIKLNVELSVKALFTGAKGKSRSARYCDFFFFLFTCMTRFLTSEVDECLKNIYRWNVLHVTNGKYTDTKE